MDHLKEHWDLDTAPPIILREEMEPERDDDEMVPTGADQKKVAGPGHLGETWWLINDEQGEMADIMERAGTSLDKMFEKFKIKPVKVDNESVLFLAHYEFQRYQKDLQHTDGKIKDIEECLGWIDFMSGFPMKNTELMLTVGQISSRKETMAIQAADEATDPIPPMPEEFFEGFEASRMLLNYLYIDEEQVDTMCKDLVDEPEPAGLHWWVRMNLKSESKWPAPGEFMGLVNRPWVTLPWGEQESSPYLFSGNWMDTVFFSSGIIQEIIDPVDEVYTFPRYRVLWRVTTENPDGIIEIGPTDFAEYRVGDRITIFKTGSMEKETQRWKDDDAKALVPSMCSVCPVIFYGVTGTAIEEQEYDRL
jgi:hypothetical protein